MMLWGGMTRREGWGVNDELYYSKEVLEFLSAALVLVMSMLGGGGWIGILLYIVR